MIKAILDACTLYAAPLRDFLLRLAENELFYPFWSEEIQNEWIRNLLRNRPDLKPESLERTRRNMDTRFPNSLVQGYESLIPTLHLPDLNDQHVLAAAIHAKAESIVTFNLADFPQSVLQFYGIEALSPDELVLRLIQKRQNRVIVTIKNHRSLLIRPSFLANEYLAMLAKQGLPKMVALLLEHESDL